MSNLISAYLMGGLGNQGFQIAHALCQGWKHNREVVFPKSSWTPMQGKTTEHYINNFFRNVKFVDSIDGFTKVHEGCWEYSEVNPLEENTIFEGYFQSPKNFFGFNDKLRDTFSPPDDFIKESFEKYPQLHENNTLSIHVRRGDYVGINQIHPTVGKTYIEKAVSLIGDYSHVFIFSDDKTWAKENIHVNNPIWIEDEDYKEIWLMSMCKNNIIANSTFSWWGSFLNRNPNKKVIAPSIWFGHGGPRFEDLYESYWTIINVQPINGELEYVA